jgi:hypothetical protein
MQPMSQGLALLDRKGVHCETRAIDVLSIRPVAKETGMKTRGERIACMVETVDGARGVYSVFAGSEPKSIVRIDPVEWGETKPSGRVKHAMFSVIAEMGMTGQIIRITGPEWLALMRTNQMQHFYATILWGGGPLKIVQDALDMEKGSVPA